MFRSAVFAVLLSFCFASGASAADLTDQEMRQLARDYWSCAVTMSYAEAFGLELEISVDEAFARFDDVIATGRVNEASTRNVVDVSLSVEHGYVPDAEPDDQPENFMTFAWRDALQCVDAFKQIQIAEGSRSDTRQAASGSANQAAQGEEINVAFLRDHYRQNRNARLIVDYITERWPSGKRLMGDPVPEMEFLAELINAISDQGMRSLSDASLLAIENKQYWQYDPAASLKVHNEYRRRLRVRRYNDREAQRWAQQVERERRSELATMANRMAERWGTSIKCTNVAPQGVSGSSYTSCRMLDRFGQ